GWRNSWPDAQPPAYITTQIFGLSPRSSRFGASRAKSCVVMYTKGRPEGRPLRWKLCGEVEAAKICGDLLAVLDPLVVADERPAGDLRAAPDEAAHADLCLGADGGLAADVRVRVNEGSGADDGARFDPRTGRNRCAVENARVRFPISAGLDACRGGDLRAVRDESSAVRVLAVTKHVAV